MTLPENGTLRRIVAGVAVAIVVFLAGAVIASQNRITAVEVKVQMIEQSLQESRRENRQEHQIITDKLDNIQREVMKK
jgi:type II secretory pathway pseudopilin PulG